jgi:hypothetical protein
MVEDPTLNILILPRFEHENMKHEKSLDLLNYEIFPHKILKSRTFKKSSILIVITYFAASIFLY